MEADVLRRVGFLTYSCPKQSQDFKPSAAPLYPNMGQVPPPPGVWLEHLCCMYLRSLRIKFILGFLDSGD